MKDLQILMNDVDEWQIATFGHNKTHYNRTISAMMAHLIEEAKELKDCADMFWANPKFHPEPKLATDYGSEEMREEFADCFMLLIGAAAKYGLTAEELLNDTKRKLEKNKLRTWGAPDENGVVKHIKS